MIPVQLKRYCLSLLFAGGLLHAQAQVISNTGASIEVGSGAVLSGGSLENAAGTIRNGGSMSIRNITVQNGAVLNNEGSLKIGGSFSISGSLTSTAGSIELNGTGAQSIPANAFTTNTIRDLTINNNSNVSLQGSLNISDYLKAVSGNFSTSTYLSLLSSAGQTAYVDGSGGGNVLGTVTMQRYLPSGFGYRYISSPFQSATVNELADDMNLNDSFATLYRYDQNVSHSGWVKHNSASVLSPMQGYAANFGADTNAKTIDVSGVVQNGSLSLTLYNHNQTYTKGFNLVGNPYPSPIDWNASNGWTKTNVDNAIYYFNNGTTDRYSGSYSSYINGVSSDGIANNIIPSMQGFFVHVSNGSYPVTATLGINNNARVNSLTPYYHKQAGGGDAGLIRISAGYEQADSLVDPMVVYFDAAATDAFEQELDAVKMLNTDDRVPNLYSMAGEKPLAINAIPEPGTSTRAIPLGLELRQEGTLHLAVQDLEHIPAGLHVYLADAETGIIQDLEQAPHYQQLLGKGHYRNRFYLLFSRQDRVQIPGTEPLVMFVKGNSLFVTLSEAQGELLISNVLGQVLQRRHLTGSGVHEVPIDDAAGAMYVVSLATNTGKKSGKIIAGQQ